MKLQNFFLGWITCLGIAICVLRIVITRNLNAGIHISNYWSAPIASEALIGFALILTTLIKFKDWKVSLGYFFLLDGLWEVVFQVYWVVNGFNLKALGPIYFQLFIALEILAGWFLFWRSKFKWTHRFVLPTVLVVIYINWLIDNFHPIVHYSQQMLEVALCLVLVTTITRRTS